MVQSTGYNKTRTAVFISGTGSNLKSLIKFSRTSKSPISIDFVISNNSKAKGLNYAKIYKIKKKVFSFKKKNLGEKKLLSILKINNIEMICLAGFMKIISIMIGIVFSPMVIALDIVVTTLMNRKHGDLITIIVRKDN